MHEAKSWLQVAGRHQALRFMKACNLFMVLALAEISKRLIANGLVIWRFECFSLCHGRKTKHAQGREEIASWADRPQ
jgi:hypothetical protein